MHLFIFWQKVLLKKPSAINLHKWSIFLIHSAAGADGNAARAWALGFWVLSSLCHPRVTRCAWQQDKPSQSALWGSVGSQQVWRAEQRALGGLFCRRVAKEASQLHPGQHSPLKLFCFVKPSGPNLLSSSAMCGSAAGMIQIAFKYLVSCFQNLIWAWLRAHTSSIHGSFREKWMNETWRSHCSRDHLSLLQSVLPLQLVDE